MKSDIFADRITDVPRSFIREILKVTLDPQIISFAGGLPNRQLFPADDLTRATSEVLENYGSDIFQYSNSEGYLELREYIAQSYSRKGLDVSASNILVTNGAQQGIDLLGKVLLNEGDGVIIEEPGYLGAIQAFSLYSLTFSPVAVNDEGMDIEQLKGHLAVGNHKLIYTVPNFQNPSGISYSLANREVLADIVEDQELFIIEDDPYGALRFAGHPKPSFKKFVPDKTILLGSFSKIIVPGFRLGWIVAPDEIFEKLLIAKQAADLHTCHFTQYIIYQYLVNNDIDAHVKKIVRAYGEQCISMLECMNTFFPSDVKSTTPEGGMFLWVTLPENMSAMDLFHQAVKEKVVFVPGDPFYIDRKDVNSFRLNFSGADCDTIEVGMHRLGEAIRRAGN